LHGDRQVQLASGGTVFLTAASTGEIERFADICREYEVPYVLGESEDAAAGFTDQREARRPSKSQPTQMRRIQRRPFCARRHRRRLVTFPSVSARPSHFETIYYGHYRSTPQPRPLKTQVGHVPFPSAAAPLWTRARRPVCAGR